jgi:hypothetical protein
VLTDILQAAIEIRPDACSPTMRGTGSATMMRGSGEEAGPPPSVQFSAVEEKSSAGLGEESERKSERRERERRGWAVRGIMARVTKRHASRALSPDVQAKPRVAPPRGWPRENARIGGIRWACVEGALTRMRAKKMREPRNPINRLLAPESLVGFFAGYQSRPWPQASLIG